MIQKPNSLQLMEEFHQLQKDIADIQNDLAEMENQINTKLSIINMYHAIAQNNAIQVKNGSRKKDSIYFSLDAENKIVGGQYDIYGQTIHSPFKAIPEQMFNFITENGQLYKDCASVYFLTGNTEWDKENSYRYDYCDILKHEADTSKKDVYQNFSSGNIVLRVRLNHTNFYGNTSCNMIEFCPYFPGTFDIQQIDIYSVTQYLAEGEEMDIVDVNNGSVSLSGEDNEPFMKNVGACRIMLPDTYQIYQVDFSVNIHANESTYPFGLRHLYFYNAKTDKINDYIIVKIEEDTYIDSIGELINIGTPSEERTNQKADLYGIEYYMTYDNGFLQNKITPSSAQKHYGLSRNLKTIYAKIPLFDCLTHIDFKDIVLR
jgi:hypothetical protein